MEKQLIPLLLSLDRNDTEAGDVPTTPWSLQEGFEDTKGLIKIRI